MTCEPKERRVPKPKKNPFKILPLDVESFLLSTAHMKNDAVGAYARILFKGWLDLWPVGTFPTDENILSELAQCTEKEWNGISKSVLRRFKPRAGGKTMSQERLALTFLQVQRRTEDKSKQAAEAGKKSGEARRERKLNGRSTDVPNERTETNDRIELNRIELNGIEPNQTEHGGEVVGVREVLEWAGVGGAVDRLCKIPNITPLAVLLEAERTRKTGGGPGVLVKNLCSKSYSPPDRISLDSLITRCRAGRIKHICGHVLNGEPVQFSNHEIVIGSVRIPESDLLAENIGVCIDKEL